MKSSFMSFEIVNWKILKQRSWKIVRNYFKIVDELSKQP